MIYELAVEPGMLNTWERFRYVTEKFGISNGRLISRYPKRWKALVYESLKDATALERKRIEVKLQNIDDKMQSRTHEWDTGLDWLLNAETEHGKRPFHAILATSNARRHRDVIAYSDLDESVAPWKVEREKVVQRSASALAAEVAPLLRIARDIVFIDKHFDPYKPRVRNTLRAFLEVCLTGRPADLKIQRLEFHTLFRPEIYDFVGECRRQLPGRIPIGVSLRIVRWRERLAGEGMHNRYILTERGGVRLAWGLDEGVAAQTDDISLLEENVFSARWKQYCSNQPAFDCEPGDDFEVVGNRVLARK